MFSLTSNSENITQIYCTTFINVNISFYTNVPQELYDAAVIRLNLSMDENWR